jgi:hypothetical protein
MKKTIAIAFLAAGMAMSIASVGAQDAEDAEVNVSVSGTTTLDVRPTELSYSGLEPGDRANGTELEANNYSTIEVENIGSRNISDVWAEASHAESDPFGTGTAAAYDAGNFIQISTETANGNEYDSAQWSADATLAGSDAERFHYVNRVEFTDYPTPTYIETLEAGEEGQLQKSTTNIGSDNLDSHVGRFREGDEWYFYTVYFDGSNNACTAASEGELWVGKDKHTPTTLGTTDFTNPNNVDVYDIESDDSGEYAVTNNSVSYGVTNLEGTTETLNYDVFMHCDGSSESARQNSHTFRTKFNTAPNATVLQDSGYSLGTSSNGDAENLIAAGAPSRNLNPGAYFPVDVTVTLPQGVVNQDINGGELQIKAQAQTQT